MRTFVAIDLDSDIKKRISAFVAELRPRSRGIKWVEPGGMHLTLKFLGEIPEDAVSDVKEALEKIAANHKPFRLKLKGTGYFPPVRKSPRVLWVGVEAETVIFQLQSEVERQTERLGFPCEERKYHPHLTLGRVKNSSGVEEVLPFLEQAREKEFGEMTVKRITLFRSVLKPSGAEYTVLVEKELG